MASKGRLEHGTKRTINSHSPGTGNYYKNLTKRIKLLPVKKMAKPSDIANYIYYISSNENQFITNELINITGGE